MSLPGIAWLDEDGRHVWWRHKCTAGDIDWMLPWPNWKAENGSVVPSIACMVPGCDFHSNPLVREAPADWSPRRGGMASPAPPLPEIESEYEEGFRDAKEMAAKLCEKQASQWDMFSVTGPALPQINKPAWLRECARQIRALAARKEG